MIEKERLQELIEQGATIYENKEGHISEIRFNNIDMAFGYKVSSTYLIFGMLNLIITVKLENLFETKEDAEFALRFKRIPRTEYLDLPTWEEFCKLVNEDIRFYRNEYTYVLQSCYYSSGEETIELFERHYDYGNTLFEKPLTKENYIKACRLAKKLFLGEEV